MTGLSAAEQRRASLWARRALHPRLRSRYSHAACKRLSRLATTSRARSIGLYWPLASEIDPRPLMSLIPTNARICLPRVMNQTLLFIEYSPSSPLRRSTLGMLEPCSGRACPVSCLDLLVMPLAGFDRHGHRIGMGGGFYDRTLAALRHCAYRRPALVGLAFECQRLDAIEPELWDIALDAIVTERTVYRRHHATRAALNSR